MEPETTLQRGLRSDEILNRCLDFNSREEASGLRCPFKETVVARIKIAVYSVLPTLMVTCLAVALHSVHLEQLVSAQDLGP